jgi:hypothetical protein
MPVAANSNQPAPTPDPHWFSPAPHPAERSPGVATWRDPNGQTLSEALNNITYAFAIKVGIASGFILYVSHTIPGICV